MIKLHWMLVIGVVLGLGCQSPTPPPAPPVVVPDVSGLVPVPIKEGTVAFDGTNSMVSFYGRKVKATHEGGFRSYRGTLQVDAEQKSVSALSITIRTGSLWADNGALARHLKSGDFFACEEHPEATFESTSIEAAEDGSFHVVGNLTLLAQTREVRFPLQVEFNDEGVLAAAGFTFDRTEFGMVFGEGEISDIVAVSVSIGDTPAGGGGPPG